MRRRRVKGADEKLLSYKDYIINGMVEQILERDLLAPSDASNFNTTASESSVADKNIQTTLISREDVSSDYLNPFDNRLFLKNEIYNNLIENYRGKWRDIFGNNNPIHLEVGTGRGKFLTGMAQANKDINYIALEIKEEVLVKAVEKADRLDLDNIVFLWGSVELFDLYFADNELNRIYVNFCDPWPKKRTAKRRLTHSNFLELYRKKLNHGEIYFKTDNRDLFEFSLNEMSGNDWQLKNISLDLANSEFDANITTEYEERFMELGMPIYRLEAIDRR
nr:tRNA (guanosine(46)-N7)-methyltransferase TrmB [uncultured Peptostreptococcus sp.]